jgi:hypothetical protein
MRKQVTVIECGRCKRIEHLDQNDGSDRSVVIYLGGVELKKVEDLCSPCQDIVKKLVDQILKPMEKKSPIRKKKEEKPEKVKLEAVPPLPLTQPVTLRNEARKEGTIPPSHAPTGRAPRA